jgi:putative ubiquitin-RnfH superfamily antitoxin RatB of RatAB toxin-antitoxin module
METTKSQLLTVEIVYASAQRQRLVTLSVAPGATVAEAIEASGIVREFPEIDLNSNRVGIFGHLVRLEDPIRAGDRVEIYRPLQADPKEACRQRALKLRRAAGRRG